jgi:ABC-2 type transport system permease protein
MIGLYAAQVAGAIRASFADRANFVIQIAGMVLNNVVFLSLWVMFFAGFKSLGGWRFADMALLIGLVMTIMGLTAVFFGGYRDLAVHILRGELDALLTQPKGLIPRLLARESNPAGWGDIGGGLVILILFAGLEARDLPLTMLALGCGLVVYLSVAIAFATLGFWMAGARTFSRDLADFTLLFSTQPGSIFQGMTKVVAFTVLPAGFIVILPVRLLREPMLETAAVLVVAALGYTVMALMAFEIGLARYRRGASPGLASD